MDVAGKKVIVTGGSGGMGTALVKVLAANGAIVTSLDMADQPGQQVVDDANQAAGETRAWFITADLTDRASVNAAFAQAVERMGGLDALVHTAGVHRITDMTDEDDATYALIMDVNVRGTVLTNLAACKAMQQSGGGSIVNFGSVSGLRPEPSSLYYSASKGAVHSWTRSLSRDVDKHAIRVNAILPMMATPMAHAAREAMTQEEILAAFGHDWDKVKWGNAEQDLAPVVGFLVSDASHFITGQLLPVDGGLFHVR